MKNYISQLKDGKMLVIEDDSIFVETTGYPYKKCRLELETSKVDVVDTESILRVLLGYRIENIGEFISNCLELDKMSLTDWKLYIQSRNIGGGCPVSLQVYAQSRLQGDSELLAKFKMLLPQSILKEDINYPNEKYLNSYKDIINKGYSGYFKLYKPLNTYVLLYLIHDEVTEEFCKLLSKSIKNCVDKEYSADLKTVTVISGVGDSNFVIVTNTKKCDVDFIFFYDKAFNISPLDCKINVSFKEDKFNLSFECTDESCKSFYEDKSTCEGTFKRYDVSSFNLGGSYV